MIYLKLFYEFAKIGLFSIGGGLATLPFLSDLGARTGWFNQMDLANMLAVSESTPGPIGVNMATYVGYRLLGIAGAVTATLGLVAPSIAVILLIAHMLKKFRDSRVVRDAFYALRPASTGLIAAAGFSVISVSILTLPEFWKTKNLLMLADWKALAFAALLFLLMKKFKWHPAVFIGLSAVIGVFFPFGK